jgi:hypothetical protein
MKANEAVEAVGAAILVMGTSVMLSCSVPTHSTPVAASGHLAIIDPAIEITLTASGDEISLIADSEDPGSGVVTYVGHDDMGHPANPAEVELGLAPEVADFDIYYITSGASEYVLAVDQATSDAYTIEFEENGGEISAVVRTIQGTQLGTATAAGDWEVSYPATQGANLTALLSIIVLGAAPECNPDYTTARQDCKAQCQETGVDVFSYSCDPNTGVVSVECDCQDPAGN